MAQVETLEIEHNFQEDVVNQAAGRAPIDAKKLDQALASVAENQNLINENLKMLQRDDGQLKDAVVGPAQMQRSVINLVKEFNLRGAYIPASYYAKNDAVDYNGSLWVCAKPHNSTSIFVESNWLRYGASGAEDVTVAAQQAQQAATAAAASLRNANTAAAAAETLKNQTEAAATNAYYAANSAATQAQQVSQNTGIASSAKARAETAALKAEAAANSGAITTPKPIASANLAILTGVYYTSGDVPTEEEYKVDVIVTDTQIIQTATNGDGSVYSRSFLKGASDVQAWTNVSNSIGMLSNFTLNVGSIAELLLLQFPFNNQKVNVTSYHSGLAKGGGIFVYNIAKKNQNDGGMVLNGWVRQGAIIPTPYMFGAYGNWNATTEKGNDDSNAFQMCSDYILKHGHMREGGFHAMHIPAGNFKITSWNLHQIQYTFGFMCFGDGTGTQLWFDRSGNGVSVNIEYTQFKDMVFNGNTIAKMDATKPPIQYIFRFKLADKRLDIDTVFVNCNAVWFGTFARVVGRGFTFQNGSFGMGGVALEIACDADINIMGEVPQMHSLESSMRHFIFNSVRTDIVETLFKITGVHSVKDYINGISVFNCEFTKLNRIAYSEDCTLIKARYVNNISIGSFASNISSGAIDIPRAKGVLDIGNTWMNYPQDDNIATDRTKGISFIHRYNSIEDLQVSNCSIKDLVWGLVRAEKVDGVIISCNVLNGYADFDNASAFIQVFGTTEIKNVLIENNLFRSKTSKTRKWIQSASTSLPQSVCIRANNCENSMPKQGVPFAIKLFVGSTEVQNYVVNDAIYNCVGNNVIIDFLCSANISTLAGNIAIGLPFNGVALNATFGGVSGIDLVPLVVGLTPSAYVFESRSGAGSKSNLKANGINVTDASKTHDVISIISKINYRIK